MAVEQRIDRVSLWNLQWSFSYQNWNVGETILNVQGTFYMIMELIIQVHLFYVICWNTGFQFLMKWEFSLSTVSCFVVETTQPVIERIQRVCLQGKSGWNLEEIFSLLSTAEAEDVRGDIILCCGMLVCDIV